MCIHVCVSRHIRVHAHGDPRLVWALASASLLIHRGRVSQTYPELADTVKLANQLAQRILSLSSETRIGEGELAHPPLIYELWGSKLWFPGLLSKYFNYWAVSPAPTFLYVKVLRVIPSQCCSFIVLPPSRAAV